MPPPSVELTLIGAVLMELEQTQPGITARLRDRMESETVRAEVINIRGPRASQAKRATFSQAWTWLGRMSLLAHSPVFRPTKGRKAR